MRTLIPILRCASGYPSPDCVLNPSVCPGTGIRGNTSDGLKFGQTSRSCLAFDSARTAALRAELELALCASKRHSGLKRHRLKAAARDTNAYRCHGKWAFLITVIFTIHASVHSPFF